MVAYLTCLDAICIDWNSFFFKNGHILFLWPLLFCIPLLRHFGFFHIHTWVFPPPLFEHMIIPSLYLEPDIYNTSVGSQMGQLGINRLLLGAPEASWYVL